MTASTTTQGDTRRRPLMHYLALAAAVLTITIGVLFYTLTGSASSATATDGSFDGDLPAMPH